jgi:hypothetical protein
MPERVRLNAQEDHPIGLPRLTACKALPASSNTSERHISRQIDNVNKLAYILPSEHGPCDNGTLQYRHSCPVFVLAPSLSERPSESSKCINHLRVPMLDMRNVLIHSPEAQTLLLDCSTVSDLAIYWQSPPASWHVVGKLQYEPALRCHQVR